MVILAWYDPSGNRNAILVLVALLTIAMATIGWVWNGRNTVGMARKTNALNLLARIGSKDVNALKDVVYPYITEYDKFKREEIAERPKMPDDAIQQLLGVYEQMSVAIIYGAVDPKMMHKSQALVTKRIYRGLYHHIEKMQAEDAGYFSEFEQLVCMWHPELQKKAAKLENPGKLFNPTFGSDT